MFAARVKPTFIYMLCCALAAGCILSGCASTTQEGTSEQSGSEQSGSEQTSSDDQSSSQTTSSLGYDFSAGLDENGYWDGVVATDYVTLCEDYLSISIPADQLDVSETVQSEIDYFLSYYATTEQVLDRAVEDGDTVNIDYVGRIDGTEFSGGSTNGAGTTVTIGVTSYIDDFLEQLIGHEPGETFDVEVTFPDEYPANEELAGLDAVFEVTINYISETVLPELTDEWVEEKLSAYYGWTSVEQMTQEITEEYEFQARLSYVQDYLLANCEVSEVPVSMIAYQTSLLLFQFEYYAAYAGYDFDTFIALYGYTSADDLVTSNAQAITNTATLYLIFQAISETDGVLISDSFVQEYFETYVGVSDFDTYVNDYGMPYLKVNVMADVVLDMVAQNATVAE